MYSPGFSASATPNKYGNAIFGASGEACYTTKSGITGCGTYGTGGDYGGKLCYTSGRTTGCINGGSGDGGSVGLSFGFKF